MMRTAMMGKSYRGGSFFTIPGPYVKKLKILAQVVEFCIL